MAVLSYRQEHVKLLNIPHTSTKEDYIFDGWFFDKNLTSPVSFPLSVDSNLTLYAKWKRTKESYISELLNYIDRQDKNYIYQEEDDSTDDKIDISTYKMSHIGQRLYYDYSSTVAEFTSSNHDYSYCVKFNASIKFDYANFENSSILINYDYESKYFTQSTSSLVAMYKASSLTKNGDVYKLNGNFVVFSPYGSYNRTEDQVKNSIQTLFDISCLGIKHIIPSMFWNTIFNYE